MKSRRRHATSCLPRDNPNPPKPKSKVRPSHTYIDLGRRSLGRILTQRTSCLTNSNTFTVVKALSKSLIQFIYCYHARSVLVTRMNTISAMLSDGSKAYPVHMLDDTQGCRDYMMALTFRFDDVLDAIKLSTSLARLLEIGDWKKLRGRLQYNVRAGPLYVYQIWGLQETDCSSATWKTGTARSQAIHA